MTDDQIRDAIRTGKPFFAVSSRHEMMARYMYYAPVFVWQKNQMIPMPLQGEDLVWWLQSRNDCEDAG